MELDSGDKEKTAFSLGKALWQYKVMAMGLKNALPTFQHLMELPLAGVDWRQCLVYLDDIHLFSPSFDDHILLLREVLSKLKGAHLKLKPKVPSVSSKSCVPWS